MKSEGFVVSMTGGGFMTGVEEISLGFEKEATPTLTEARLYYVNGVRDLLARVNDSKELRPYLRSLPFTVKNLTYGLGFVEEPVFKPGYEPIAYVSYGGGTVNYSVFDPSSGHGNPLRNVHRESFEEAKRIVDESDRKTGH